MATGEGKKGGKIVLDPVYGIVHLDELAVQIIDRRYFQRLRYIKQLSFADYVHPGATHARFAHSIGVYHLACEMIKEIDLHEAAKWNDDDRQCVRVAALCHDLGHGPFSHLYNQIAEEVLVEGEKLQLEHEEISAFLVGKIFEKEDIRKLLHQEDQKAYDCIEVIKDLIKGANGSKDKKYMYQIVSNAGSKIDVDKWDYFNRDAKSCGVPERFQYDRALCVARIVNTEEGIELGYRDKDVFNFYNMFNTRLTMYRKVYNHKAVVAVDLMEVFNYEVLNILIFYLEEKRIPQVIKIM